MVSNHKCQGQALVESNYHRKSQSLMYSTVIRRAYFYSRHIFRYCFADSCVNHCANLAIVLNIGFEPTISFKRIAVCVFFILHIYYNKFFNKNQLIIFYTILFYKIRISHTITHIIEFFSCIIFSN